MLIRILIFLFCLPATVLSEPNLLISVFNVGEGDSILIVNKESKETILIDAGTIRAGQYLASQFQKFGIRKINHLIISHPHPDHFGGVAGLKPFIAVESFYDNGESLEGALVEDPVYKLYKPSVRSNKYSVLNEGDVLNSGNLKLQVLSSATTLKSKDWNTNSLVLLLEYDAFKMLFMGDGNIETENYLVNKYCGKLKSHVLKAGHHGAADTASKKFVECVRPELVAVSVEEGNKLGSPAPETIKTYESIPAKVHITKSNGELILEIGTNGEYKVKD